MGLFAIKNAWASLAPDQDDLQRKNRLRRALIFAVSHGFVVVIAGFVVDPTPMVESILVNDLDVRNSTWVVVDGQNRMAKPEVH